WDQWQYRPTALAGEPQIIDQGDREPEPFTSGGGLLPAPLPTFRRVQFGPPLARVEDWAGAVHYLTPVSLTPYRINLQVDGGELDRWPETLGRSWSDAGQTWETWNQSDWDTSRFHAVQLQRWLNTDVTSQEAAASKWSAIANAFAGIPNPRD